MTRSVYVYTHKREPRRGKSRPPLVLAYVSPWNGSFAGVCIHQVSDGGGGVEAKRAAIKEHRERCLRKKGGEHMGAFRIVIDGVGGHGDDRTAKEGEAISIPASTSDFKSPDQLAVEAVHLFMGKVTDLKATLTHWPGEPSEVVDDLVEMKRVKGQF